MQRRWVWCSSWRRSSPGATELRWRLTRATDIACCSCGHHVEGRWSKGSGGAMTLRPDFTSQEYFRNPAVGIEKLRTTGPVVEVRFPIVGKVWITTTHELASRVLKDGATS